jgi:HEPN domain-containing protein
MKKDEVIKYWIESAERDMKTMIHLYEKKDFHWSLFLGHLVIEKFLKALYVKKKSEQPPYIHNLLRIADKAEITFTEEQLDILTTITSFNIEARYDDYKSVFYRKCTFEYTTIWIDNIKEIAEWIKEKL